jgi:hypothetical protein
MNITQLNREPFEQLLLPNAEAKVTGAYTSDLLSDVMGHAPDDSVLITIQAHKNTVAVATLAGINAVMLCNSRPVPDDMIEAAREEGIALFRTPENQFQTSVRIQKLLEQSAS